MEVNWKGPATAVAQVRREWRIRELWGQMGSMTNCYRCGRPILGTSRHVRRRVPTGLHEHIRYPSGKFRAIRTTYGMRIVCSACARILDRQRAAETAADNWKLIFALVALAIVSIARWLGI